MRSFTRPHALLVALAALAACDPDGSVGDPVLSVDGDSEAALALAANGPARTCVVAAPRDVVALAASAAGVVLGVPSAHPDGPPLLVSRWHGAGCDLAPNPGQQIAAGALLDLDDRGNLYVFPAEAGPDDARSTMLPGEYPESMVAHVDLAGRVTKLLPAGRGIWGFGVAPDGDALWVSACGPNGLFAIDTGGVTPGMAAPDTLWEQFPNVLTAAQTFWSVGYRTCAPADALTPACGYDLVRTTPAGSDPVATTVVDLGAGFEQATLSRCGAHVCGRTVAGVIVWGNEGEVLRRLTPADLSIQSGEQITQVAGDDHGIYALLHGEHGARIVFVPA